MPLKRKPIHFCARCSRRVIRLGNGALRHCNGGGYKKPPVCIGPTLRKKRVAKHATSNEIRKVADSDYMDAAGEEAVEGDF